ncbi:hypothetical protein EC890511_3091, partial [Escherichia coli 89.0511]
RILRFEMA